MIYYTLRGIVGKNEGLIAEGREFDTHDTEVRRAYKFIR